VQQEAPREDNGTAARRKRAYQLHNQQGLDHGLAQGLKQGLAEAQEIAYQKGFEEVKKLARATSRSEFKATAPAVDFVVTCQQGDNWIAELDSVTGARTRERSSSAQRNWGRSWLTRRAPVRPVLPAL
jgi:hypothetical protein